MHSSAEFTKIGEDCGYKCVFSECQTQRYRVYLCIIFPIIIIIIVQKYFVLLDRTVKDMRMGANVSEFWCWVLSAAKIKVPLSTLIGQTGKKCHV